MQIFKYDATEMNYLKSRDALLGVAMDRIGKVERRVIPDLFTALIHAIVGQQISTKAAATVWGRILKCYGAVTPQIIAGAPVEEIQQCGLSTRKAGYIKNAGEKIVSGELNLEELYALPDNKVIERLSALRGIGTWTAEMLLFNSMERPDVVSWGDIAIRRGMMKLYGLPELTKKQFDEYRKIYSPYGSVASIYLWEIYGE